MSTADPSGMCLDNLVTSSSSEAQALKKAILHMRAFFSAVTSASVNSGSTDRSQAIKSCSCAAGAGGVPPTLDMVEAKTTGAELIRDEERSLKASQGVCGNVSSEMSPTDESRETRTRKLAAKATRCYVFAPRAVRAEGRTRGRGKCGREKGGRRNSGRRTRHVRWSIGPRVGGGRDRRQRTARGGK